MNKKQKSLLVSMTLGDGYIDKDNYLSIQHGAKQKDYLEHKKNLLIQNGLKTSRTYNVSRWRIAYRFNCVEPHILKHYKHSFYPNRNKTITRHLLNQLDEEGLAVWFMDDGCCIKRYKNGFGNGRYLQISTNCFTLKEHEVIVKYFKVVWNIEVMIKACKRRDRALSYCLRFNVENSKKFIEIIKPFVIDSMKYKINFEYKDCKIQGAS